MHNKQEPTISEIERAKRGQPAWKEVANKTNNKI
jgi:hypothetical protein